MGFDCDDVPDEVLIPPGTRARVRVEQAIQVPTKNGDGLMLEVRLRIVEGRYSGDSLFDRALMKHPNEKAKRMGNIRIRDLSRAVGVTKWEEAYELNGRVCEVEIGVEPAHGSFAARNIVARYFGDSGSTAPKFGYVPPISDADVPF